MAIASCGSQARCTLPIFGIGMLGADGIVAAEWWSHVAAAGP
jgi:hypothetical protein